MKKMFAIVLALLILMSFASGAVAQDANLSDTCVENYDPAVDYFPDKAELNYAEGFTIDYFNNYKVITVVTPWLDATDPFTYVLVQCGTPAPEGFGDAQIIEVPTGDVIAMSTTQLPHFDQLNLVDHLVGVETYGYIYNERVQEKIQANEVAEVGFGSSINMELVLDLDPDLVMTYSAGLPEYDAHPILLEAGIPTVINAEWTENTPLGRAEWLKFTAAFFNREADASQIFEAISDGYEDIAFYATTDEERPTVFLNTPFEGTWYIPGGQGYLATLLRDAGADYVWADDSSPTTLYLDFESVFEQATEADIWLVYNTWTDLASGLAEDERYSEFSAFQNGNVYNGNLRISAGGGFDIYKSGVTNPDILLADLVKIFHPDLLPDHELFYYQKLD